MKSPALMLPLLLCALFAAAPAVAQSALPAWAQSAAPDADDTGDGGTIRLVENPNGSIVMITYVIQKYHLDSKYGFKLQIVPVSNIQSATIAIKSGAADIGTADFLVVARLRASGTGVVGVAPLLRWNDDIVARADSGITSFGDLKGKRLGTINRVSSPWLIMRAAASRVYHFDLQKDCTIEQGNIALLRGLLEQKRLDASYMFDNFTPALIASGKYRLVVHISDLVSELGLPPDSPYLLLMSTSAFATTHPADLRAFLAADREAVNILQTNNAVWNGLAPVLKTPPALQAATRDEMRRVLLSKFSPDSQAAMQQTFNLLLQTVGAQDLGLAALPAGFISEAYD